jgi:hypothetical protein
LVLYIKDSWKISNRSTCRHTNFSIRARKSHQTSDVIVGIEMATLLIMMATLLAHFKGNKLGLNLGGDEKDGMVLAGYL